MQYLWTSARKVARLCFSTSRLSSSVRLQLLASTATSRSPRLHSYSNKLLPLLCRRLARQCATLSHRRGQPHQQRQQASFREIRSGEGGERAFHHPGRPRARHHRLDPHEPPRRRLSNLSPSGPTQLARPLRGAVRAMERVQGRRRGHMRCLEVSRAGLCRLLLQPVLRRPHTRSSRESAATRLRSLHLMLALPPALTHLSPRSTRPRTRPRTFSDSPRRPPHSDPRAAPAK
ncbi:hypothetical protein BJY59DRAFT_293915 [Rhodotorula toruloides]